jgi:hypothetical protein
LRVEPPKTPLSFEQWQAVISDNFLATSGNLRQRWESIGKANEHAGSFGKWPEEYE